MEHHHRELLLGLSASSATTRNDGTVLASPSALGLPAGDLQDLKVCVEMTPSGGITLNAVTDDDTLCMKDFWVHCEDAWESGETFANDDTAPVDGGTWGNSWDSDSGIVSIGNQNLHKVYDALFPFDFYSRRCRTAHLLTEEYMLDEFGVVNSTTGITWMSNDDYWSLYGGNRTRPGCYYDEIYEDSPDGIVLLEFGELFSTYAYSYNCVPKSEWAPTLAASVVFLAGDYELLDFQSFATFGLDQEFVWADETSWDVACFDYDADATYDDEELFDPEVTTCTEPLSCEEECGRTQRFCWLTDDEDPDSGVVCKGMSASGPGSVAGDCGAHTDYGSCDSVFAAYWDGDSCESLGLLEWSLSHESFNTADDADNDRCCSCTAPSAAEEGNRASQILLQNSATGLPCGELPDADNLANAALSFWNNDRNYASYTFTTWAVAGDASSFINYYSESTRTIVASIGIRQTLDSTGFWWNTFMPWVFEDDDEDGVWSVRNSGGSNSYDEELFGSTNSLVCRNQWFETDVTITLNGINKYQVDGNAQTTLKTYLAQGKASGGTAMEAIEASDIVLTGIESGSGSDGESVDISLRYYYPYEGSSSDAKEIFGDFTTDLEDWIGSNSLPNSLTNSGDFPDTMTIASSSFAAPTKFAKKGEIIKNSGGGMNASASVGVGIGATLGFVVLVGAAHFYHKHYQHAKKKSRGLAAAFAGGEVELTKISEEIAAAKIELAGLQTQIAALKTEQVQV